MCLGLMKLHILSQIQSSCLCTQLSVCVTAPRTSKAFFFPSHVKILFCTDKTESIEWQEFALRQRTGDCLWIHIPHRGRCDPPLSSHQTFLREVELRQCVFCKEPLSFWFSSRRRNLGLSGSEYKCCASSMLNAVLRRCCYHFRGMFRIRDLRNLCGCRHFCVLKIICEIL